MFFVFLSRYRNTRESLGELEKAVETRAYGLCFHIISRSPKLLLVSIKQLDYEREISIALRPRQLSRVEIEGE